MADKNNRRAGIVYVKIDGALQEAKGSFSYGLGIPKRDPIIGADGVHGFKETPTVAFIEGAITDSPDLALADFQQQDGVTVTLELNNGKTIVLADAWFAAEGTVTTDEAEIPARWESRKPATEM